MKKRTAFIGALLSLIPLGQPLLLKSGIFLSASGIIVSFPEKADARDAIFYYNRGNDKAERGDHYGAISDYTKAIEIKPKDEDAYYNRGNSKDNIEDY